MRRAFFADRNEAGRALAEALDAYSEVDDVVLLALPRGGVPVAYEVAQRLEAPLDVIVVRKIGTPGNQELAMGAVASGGTLVRNEQVIAAMRVDDDAFAHVVEQKQREVRDREDLFRPDRPALGVDGKIVIVVDDGVATGSTITAALRALRQRKPGRVVAAVPVGSTEAVSALDSLADEVHVLETPTPFLAVGHWYEDFPQVADKEVMRLLKDAAERDLGTKPF